MSTLPDKTCDQHTPSPVKVAGGYEYRGALIWKPKRPRLTRFPWYIGARGNGDDFRTLRAACVHLDRAAILKARGAA